MANQIEEPANVWELERYLTQRRKEIESQIRFSFFPADGGVGTLLCERRISEEELRGLREDKDERDSLFRQSFVEDAA
jgi:hypothetical protein